MSVLKATSQTMAKQDWDKNGQAHSSNPEGSFYKKLPTGLACLSWNCAIVWNSSYPILFPSLSFQLHICLILHPSKGNFGPLRSRHKTGWDVQICYLEWLFLSHINVLCIQKLNMKILPSNVFLKCYSSIFCKSHLSWAPALGWGSRNVHLKVLRWYCNT